MVRLRYYQLIIYYQTTKDNQDVLNQLAFAACDLVYTVHKTYQDLYPLHPSSLSYQNLKTQFSSDLLLKEHVDELMRCVPLIVQCFES